MAKNLARENIAGIRSVQSRIAVRLSTALDRSIDRLEHGEFKGVEALAEKISEALQEDAVGTLHKLAMYMPTKLLSGDIATGPTAISVTVNRGGVTVSADDQNITIKDAKQEPIDVDTRVIEGD